jgi:sortase A
VSPVFHRVLSVVGKTLIAAGVILLLFVAYQLWGTSLEHSRDQNQLTRQLGRKVDPHGTSPSEGRGNELDTIQNQLATVDPATAPALAAPAEGGGFGIIEIPKIGVQQVMVEGVAKADLKKGPGHYPGTPLPGQAGNAALAGHRTTYGAPFNRIDELAPGDPIEIYTAQGHFRYEVMAPPPGVGIEHGPGWFSVKPTQVTVLAPTGDNRLTLTACHPKHSASQRIIVQAKLVAEPAATTPPPTGESASSVGQTSEAALFSGDGNAKWPALAFGLAFLGVWLVAWLIGRRWKRWPVYLIAAPGLIVLLWFCFYFTDHWLPSF